MDRSLDSERDEIIRSTVRDAGLGAILAWYPEDIVMTCGLWSCLGINLCIYPVDGTPHFFAPANEPPDSIPEFAEFHPFALGPDWQTELAKMIADTLSTLGVTPANMGIAGDDGGHAMTTFPGESPPLTHTAVTQGLLAGAPLAVVPELFTALTATKTSREQAAVRRANDVACLGLQTFYDSLAPGATEALIAAAVEHTIHCASGSNGIGLARGWAHVQGGENIYSGGTFSRSSGNELSDGDMVIIELATCVDGYWSDLTRTAGVGSLSQERRDLLAAVQEAQAAAIAAIQAGAPHAAPYAAARGVFAGKGLAEGFPHNAGHHVGFRYHDRGPTLLPGSDALLEPGMIVTVEPGTYAREYGGGARFEDDVVVTASGCEVLSCLELQPY